MATLYKIKIKTVSAFINYNEKDITEKIPYYKWHKKLGFTIAGYLKESKTKA